MFRSWKDLKVHFDAGATALIGPNASGKTSVLEAAWYCASLSSHRTSADVSLVSAGEDQAILRCDVERAGRTERIELSADGARLAAGSQDVGEASELVDGKYEGEPLTVAFNPAYLLDGVNAVEGSEVVLACRDGLKPSILRSPEEGNGFLYLVMPVRI